MSAPARPYTPETLADRWGCSSEKIRRMFHDGELVGFRLGKLIRIPANEVDPALCSRCTNAMTGALTHRGERIANGDDARNAAPIGARACL